MRRQAPRVRRQRGHRAAGECEFAYRMNEEMEMLLPRYVARMADQTKFLLQESDIPTHWVNLMPDLPGDPLPPLHPGTKEPAGPDDLTPLFPAGLIMREGLMDPGFAPPAAAPRASKRAGPPPRFPPP